MPYPFGCPDRLLTLARPRRVADGKVRHVPAVSVETRVVGPLQLRPILVSGHQTKNSLSAFLWVWVCVLTIIKMRTGKTTKGTCGCPG